MDKPEGCPGKINNTSEACKDCPLRHECITKTQEEMVILASVMAEKQMRIMERQEQKGEEEDERQRTLPSVVGFYKIPTFEYDDAKTIDRFGRFYRMFCALTGTPESSEASITLLKLYFEHAFAFEGAGGVAPEDGKLP